MLSLNRVTAAPALPPGPRLPGRLTRNAQALLTMLTGRERPATAYDLYDELRSGGHNTGLTTIYRGLHSLAESGAVHEFRIGDQSAYLVCPAEPHEHLICRVCGRVSNSTSTPPAAGRPSRRTSASRSSSNASSSTVAAIAVAAKPAASDGATLVAARPGGCPGRRWLAAPAESAWCHRPDSRNQPGPGQGGRAPDRAGSP